jgi:hypothetical protein
MPDFLPRGNKRYLPPFRIAHNASRRGGAPLIVKDARDWPIAKFTRWRYAFMCLTALCARYDLPAPDPDTERWRYYRSIKGVKIAS